MRKINIENTVYNVPEKIWKQVVDKLKPWSPEFPESLDYIREHCKVVCELDASYNY